MLNDMKAALSKRAWMGATILGLCVIDTLGVLFEEQAEGQEAPWGSKKRFVKFIENSGYLDKYGWPLDSDERRIFGRDLFGKEITTMQHALYHGMRCCMVHNYTASGFYFRHDLPGYHLKRVRFRGEKESVLIDVPTLIRDIDNAAQQYLSDLEAKPSLLERYQRAVGDHGLLGPVLNEPQDVYVDGAWKPFSEEKVRRFGWRPLKKS